MDSLKKTIIKKYCCMPAVEDLSTNRVVLLTTAGIVTGTPIKKNDDSSDTVKLISSINSQIINSYCEKHQLSDVKDLDGDDGCITLKEVTITLNGIQVKHDIMTFFFDQIVGVTLASNNTSQI